MKKVLLAVFAVTLVTASLQAQGIRLGAKVGTNLNKVSGQSFNDGFDLAYHVGGFLEIDFNKNGVFSRKYYGVRLLPNVPVLIPFMQVKSIH